MKNKFLSLLVLFTLLSGCFQQSTLNPNSMTYDEAQSVKSIKRGVIIGVEQSEVSIEGTNGAAAGGAAAGGLLGSTLSSGSGRDVAIVAGAVGGALLGKALSAKKEMAFIYTVELQYRDGIIQVAQTGNMLPVGTKVFVRTFANGRKTLSLDQSQGKVFSGSKETVYDNEDEY